MNKDLISVIIPAYNVENLIGRTLDSILSQTYTSLEIIVVDDGSTDSTRAVIGRYAALDRRIKMIEKENGGVSSARLKGIEVAHGDWVCFVDADDTVEPWMYERLLSNAKSYHADISHCGYQMVLPSGTIRNYYGTGKIVRQDNHAGIKDLLEGAFVEPGIWNKLYSCRVIDAFMAKNKFDTSLRNMEDLLMNFYLFQEAECSVFEDVCPYHYIVRSDSAANKPVNRHQLQDPLKVKRILFDETCGVPVHHTLAANQLIRQLVALSTVDSKKSPEITKPIRLAARKELRERLLKLIASPCSAKFALMGLWAAAFPNSYGLVHSIYEKITGLDNIYEK